MSSSSREDYQRIQIELQTTPSLSSSERSTVDDPTSSSHNNGATIVEHNNDYHAAHPSHQGTQHIRRNLGLLFWASGLLNNAGYVIMIAAAKSISEGGVALVFLANILPALVVKGTAPYWFEKVPYELRLVSASVLMVASFAVVASSEHLVWQLGGVACASAQGGLGEASLLALAGRIDGELAEVEEGGSGSNNSTKNTSNIDSCAAKKSSSSKGTCLNGFSSGTGFAGVFGFFWKWFWNDWLGLPLGVTLWLATGLAVGYLGAYRTIARLRQTRLPELRVATTSAALQPEHKPPQHEPYRDDHNNNNALPSEAFADEVVEAGVGTPLYGTNEGEDCENDEDMSLVTSDGNPLACCSATKDAKQVQAIASLGGLERFFLVLKLWPYMVPLFTVYVAEYTLQSGTWTAIGFPVTDETSRDRFFEYSNWIYQAGVFVSRSSGALGVAPMALLWVMPVLQCLNVGFYWAIGAHQLTADGMAGFWFSPAVLYPTALYTGLLGGAVYIHGYLRICRDLPLEHREFALSATSLAECLGIVVADVLGLLVQACLYRINGLDGAAVACPAGAN